jgi:DNA repair protein RadC
MTSAAAHDKPHYLGHRQRLRDRFLQSGGEALPDYEMLELVLFLARPRGDMKPLAKTLLDRFGSFAQVISADPKALAAITGVGASAVAAFKTVQAAALRLTRAEVMDRPVLSTWQKLLDYCHASMAYGDREQFRVHYLNRKNILIADELQHEGTIDQTAVYPREVIKRALEVGAAALIMVHNHPSGDPTPSRADIDMTREVREAGEKLGIALHDHIVVAKRGNSSFKALGLL